ncbi:MAG: 1-acyl-sn-glycerol-3-phosphate acyltransferase [Candidatus Kerfeldbacteria bacterium]|nr:1-acyl-sn-glycerol-3-phosphate acyltransferase [Candidatus Kerfeldbacteria bacterium]
MTYATVRRLCFPLFTARLARVDGSEHIPEPPYVIASNHVDFLDGFYLAAAFFRARGHTPLFLTKTDNYRWTSATIPIDPDRPGATLDVALDRLRAGSIICNFPEGHRNHTDRIGEGKTGTVRLARLAGVPVVPVGLAGGAHPRLFVGSLWHLVRGGHPVIVRIGRPIRFAAGPAADPTTLHTQTNELMRTIAALCGKRVGL